MIIKEVAETATDYIKDLSLIDHCLCLRGGYVIVEGVRGRALGFAHIPYEDIHDLGEVKKPRLEEMPEFVVDENPLNRVIGVAMVNAVSQYHMAEVPPYIDIVQYSREDPVCVVGNMYPLVERFRKDGRVVYVFEKSRELRSGAYSDVEIDILLPQCRTVVITGMTLLNFTIDKILHLSKGFNILTGPTAGVHPDFLPNRVKGSQLHAIASIRLDIEKTVIHLKLGGYISLAKHRDLGRPYTFLLQKSPHTGP
ncbi:MAG: DUF364 domain-containing protein [Pyrobaculum sp.]